MHDPGDVTRLLRDCQAGDQRALSQLIAIVYGELRRLAAYYMKNERPDHTLQPTALVHEAYLRLVGRGQRDWRDRAHFFAVAAETMRKLLVDHARARLAAKRGGNQTRVDVKTPTAPDTSESEDLIALHEALARLNERDPRQARVVELRHFGGLSIAEVAAVLGISERTVKREWGMAKAWLHAELREPSRKAASLTRHNCTH